MSIDIKKLVEETFGVVPFNIEHMSFGHKSKVFRFELPDDKIIIRTNTDKDVFLKTSKNISILSSLGLPVPTVIHSDVTMSKYPFSYMILREIEGRDLRFEIEKMTIEQLRKLATEIVSFQRKVSSLPKGLGFGWVSINEKGPFSSWAEIIERDFHAHIGNAENELSKKQLNDLELLKKRYYDYFSCVEPICFLDDLTIKNVIVLNGELQGIIDFDWVCYGDPLFMIGLTQTAIISDIGKDRIQYIEEICAQWDVNKFQRDIIDFYSIIHAFRFIGFHKENKNQEPRNRLLSFIVEKLEALK